MKSTNTMTAGHQNFMLAVRREMGWPAFKPANDCLCFCAGQPMDFVVGSEVARISQMIGKDVIFTGWRSTKATEPTSFTIVYREMLTIEIIDRVVPFSANDDTPMIFVSTRADEFFAVDQRGSLVRVPGKPAGIAKGRALAMKRIRTTAATLGDELLTGNRFVPTGADWIEQEAAAETIVRFN